MPVSLVWRDEVMNTKSPSSRPADLICFASILEVKQRFTTKFHLYCRYSKKESHQETKRPRAFALEFLFVQVYYVVSVCLFAFHVKFHRKNPRE